MKDNESDGSIYIYLHTINYTNHVRLQSYLTLYAVYKTLNTTEYYMWVARFSLSHKSIGALLRVQR